MIKIIRNILDKYHPRSPFDLTEINGGGFNHTSAAAILDVLLRDAAQHYATVSNYFY